METNYYIVEGWFDESNGMHNDKFYGAMDTLEDPFMLIPVVIEGQTALKASRIASSNPMATRDEVLDPETYGREEKGATLSEKDKPEPDNVVNFKGDRKNRPHRELGDQKSGDLQKESVGTGSIAAFPGKQGGAMKATDGLPKDCKFQEIESHLSIHPASSGKLGMSDRGGHGHIDKLGPKQPKTQKERVDESAGKKKPKLPHSNPRGPAMKTINQAGGVKGGRG